MYFLIFRGKMGRTEQKDAVILTFFKIKFIHAFFKRSGILSVHDGAGFKNKLMGVMVYF
jgi:hypothetical protein